MGTIHYLFKHLEPPPEEEQRGFNPDEDMTDELRDSLADVAAMADSAWLAPTRQEFAAVLKKMKREVARWPDG